MAPDLAIAARIHTALADYLKKDVRTIEARHALRDDLGLDSMGTIELLYRIEETFDLQIPDEDLQKLRTVGDVTTYVEGRLKSVPKAGPVKKAAKPSSKRPSTKKKG
ncbi:MAG: acyl carrier protein [Nitrospirae bacterium]|nr:acyl carrier protein [Nitrospirota bacterium]